jgi:hypothetical protein
MISKYKTKKGHSDDSHSSTRFLVLVVCVSTALGWMSWEMSGATKLSFVEESTASDTTAKMTELPERPSPTPAQTHETREAAAAAAIDHSSHDPEVVRQLQMLDEILANHNDNDPRLDSDLRMLKPEARQAMREKYQTLPTEQRNNRGTLVFLLGRNLDQVDDFDFISQVLAEPACLSLENCSHGEKPAQSGDVAHGGVHATVLAYPQIVALRSLKKILEHSGEDAGFRLKARDLISVARQSPIPEVAHMAEHIDTSLAN